MTDDIDFLAVHGLAVRKAAAPVKVADLLGVDEAAVTDAFARAAEVGRIAGTPALSMVTPAGQEWLVSQYPVVYAQLRQVGQMGEAYDRFERVNTDLLALFTDWQVMRTPAGSVPNDHSDTDYDHAIVDRLGDLHTKAERVVGRCAESQPRLGQYLTRLANAYDLVLAGDNDYVSGVRVESYHTVWFELHEDLLRMLGRTRQE